MSESDKCKIIVLGIAQDAGYPHAGCKSDCCREAWINKDLQRYAACIGIVDPKSNSYWLIDATPDIKFQMNMAEEKFPECRLKGIFLTHAHTGHYTGLIHFGKEAMRTDNLPVYVMPKMKKFILENLPWKQLENSKHIKLCDLKNEEDVKLNERISVKPFLVPHRDEHSETVGYRINLNNKKCIYIPDIDSWELWDKDITEVIKNSDILFFDGTFFDENEIKGYRQKNIPHPTVADSMKRFESLSSSDKSKIHFIHLNHTNLLLNNRSKEWDEVVSKGYNVSIEERIFEGN